MFDKIESGLKKGLQGTKNWVARHPALTGAAVAGGAAVAVIGTGGLALIPIVGITAGGAAIGAHIGRDDEQKAPGQDPK
jgi:hypothetical protein